jgi:hypothetical protein
MQLDNVAGYAFHGKMVAAEAVWPRLIEGQKTDESHNVACLKIYC